MPPQPWQISCSLAIHILMFVAVLAVVIVAPFERALFTLPGGVTVTSVELVTLTALLTVALADLRGRSAVTIRGLRGVAVAALAFLAALALAALAAPVAQGNAWRFVLRMAVALGLCVATARTIDTELRARIAARVLLAVATVIAAIAVLEAMQVPAVMNGLTAFRPGFHVVAGQLRATSTLIYPTIASMYLEVAFAVGLWLLLQPSRRHARIEQSLAFVALVVIGAGISATFTRAGLLAMGAALAVVGALRAGRGTSAPHADLRLLSVLSMVLVGVIFVAHSPELLAARATTEGSSAWYGARYTVPPTLTMQTAGLHRVPVVITNTGRLTWSSSEEPAFALSYHWLRAGADDVVIFEGQRTKFPAPVRPGQHVTLEADVFAPGEPGAYTLIWDVVHETRAWLSTEGVTPAQSHVRVTGERATAIPATMRQLPRATRRPARPELWSAALRIAAENPLLGIGPDNYRLAYGRYLVTSEWDSRVHANNMYLEVLTGAGAIGLSALVWLLLASGRALWRRLQDAAASAHAAAAAALAVWVVIAGHGLVDSFLSFTTTYVTFAVVAGLALSPGLVQGAPDAHCV